MLFRESNSRSDSYWIIFLRIKLNSVFVTTIYFFLECNNLQFSWYRTKWMDGIAVTKAR